MLGRALSHESRETVVAVLVSSTGSDLSGVWHKRLYDQVSHELACHFIAPRALNVTIAA